MKKNEGFDFKVCVYDKEGKLIKGVFCKTKDEMERMKNALYWIMNFVLKIGVSFKTIDVRKEEQAKKKKIADAQAAIEKQTRKQQSKVPITQAEIFSKFISSLEKIDGRLAALEEMKNASCSNSVTTSNQKTNKRKAQ